MPGYASWEDLYKEEFRVLTEEGYDTESAVKPNGTSTPLPIPNREGTKKGDEQYWKQCYDQLWAIREKGIRSDYQYEEPESFEEIIKSASAEPNLIHLTDSEYENRIKGAIYGRIAGVVLGKPLEIGWGRKQIKNYLESVDEYPLRDFVSGYSEKMDFALRGDCVPSTKGNVRFAQSDDDIHYTLLAMLLAEKKGFYFSAEDVGQNWIDNIPYHWFWCASRQAYYRMVNLNYDTPKEEQIAQIPYKLNPWRECIDGQIRCDLWGYISPCNLKEAARMAYADCSFSLIKNGCYGGMFVAGCIAAALSKNPTVESIIQGGLSVIPQKSRLAEAIMRVVNSYNKCKNWETVCGEIEERCKNMAFADTINNISMVVLALLHGNLDYEKTITTAVMCGIDTDCNGGTAGSICGAAIGIENIERRWIEPFNDSIHSVVADIGHISITEVIDRTIALYLKKRAN